MSNPWKHFTAATSWLIISCFIVPISLLSACDHKPAKSPPEPSADVQPNVDLSTPAAVIPASAVVYESRYDQPPEHDALPSMIAPMGHALALAGYDFSDSDKPRLAWNDPADNLVDGKGVNRWAAKAAYEPVTLTSQGMILTVDARRAAVFGLILIESISPPADAEQNLPASPASQMLIDTMPDLSQHASQSWQNFCAPTAAADVIYSLRHYDTGLKGRLPAGPGALADTAAIQNIAGLDAPPARAGSLANLMQSSVTSGTSAEQLVSGLQIYLQNNALADDTWHVRYVDIQHSTPTVVYTLIQNTLTSHGGVIIAMQWAPQETQNTPVASRADQRAHGNDTTDATTQEAEDSPKTTAQVEQRQDASAAQSQLRAPINHTTVNMTQPSVVPRQVDTSLPQMPTAIDLPPIHGVAQTTALPASVVTRNALTGSWKQIKGANTPDFSAGGYQDNTLVFGEDGVLRVVRNYQNKNKIMVTQQFSYHIENEHTLVIRAMVNGPRETSDTTPEPTHDAGFMADALAAWLDTSDPVIKLPVRRDFKQQGSQLELMHKTYLRQQ